MDKVLLISQIFDNAFPNGAYSHSFGFESFLRLNLINDEKSFLKCVNPHKNEKKVFT